MRQFFWLLLFCIVSVSGFAQDLTETSDNPNRTTTPVPKELTLRDAIMLALRYHPNVRNAEIDRVTQKYSLLVAQSVFDLQYALGGTITSAQGSGTGATRTINPSVSLKTAIGTEIRVSGSDQNGPPGGNQGASINVKQPLMRGYGTDVVLTPLMDAYDRERINKLDFKQKIMAKVTAVIQAYVNVVRNENSLVTQELTLKDSLNRLEQERIKVKAGRMAPADLVQVEANFARQQVSILSVKSALEQSRLFLLTEIGLDPNTQITISKSVHLPTEEIPGLKKATELILKNDPNYQAQLINRAVYQRALLVAKDNLRLTLNMTVASSTGRGPGAGGQSAGLEFSVPIDSGNTLKQALLLAQTTVKKAAIDLQYKKWGLESDVLNKLRTLENQRQQVETSAISNELAKRSLWIAEKKLQYGRASTFETTTLRNQLITAEITAINAKNDYVSAIATLQQALGTTLDIWKIEVRY
jgi:outer membrane protein TolC